MKLPRIAEPLRHRDFRLLWAGQTLSLVGGWMRVVAIPFQIFALGGSAVEIGITAAIATAVQVPVLVFGGAVVDRIPRRIVLLVSDLASAVAMSTIALLGFTGQLRIEHLYAMSAFHGLADAFFGPAMGAIIPELVPDEVLASGNALRGISRQAGRMGGSLLGGLVVATLGPPVAFAFDAVTFFASFLALAVMRPRRALTGPRQHLLREIREGFAFVFSLPWLWVTIALFSVINAAAFGPLNVGLPILVRDVLRADAATFGAITAAVAVGELVGGVAMGQARVRRSGLVMYAFAVLAGFAIASMGVLPMVGWLLAASAILGVSFVGFTILWETALQRHVPRRLLGRVTSVDYFGSLLLGPVTPLVAGVLVEAYGAVPIFIGGGVLVVLLSLPALLVRSIRVLE